MLILSVRSSSYILLCLFVPSWAADDNEKSECLSGKDVAVETSLLQKKRARRHWSQDAPANAVDVDVGTYGLATLPDMLLERMVMSNRYKCKFLFAPGDIHAATCSKTLTEAGLHPANLTVEGNRTAERINSLRTLLPIGALPCCATAPFCAAPTCATTTQFGALLPSTCTKRSPKVNFAYMVHPDVWPAYHGQGGSLELDVQKHWDILARLDGLRPHLPPFDLSIDLGANYGLVTEKLAMRRLAKDYIMVEAIPRLSQVFASRLGNVTWRAPFVQEQFATWQDAAAFDPQFEFMNFALSDTDEGFLDTCSFNWGNFTPVEECTAKMSTVDSLIPGKLTPDFVARFQQAQSAYVKVDVEGMDQMILSGMKRLLSEERGNGYLVNFMMLEFCMPCMEAVRKQNKLDTYDLKTFAATLESLGFEAFLIGPRYLPLTHGSWDDAFVEFSKNPESTMCNENYPKFKQFYPEGYANGECAEKRNIFTADIFALRSSHPKSAEIKVALGACEESKDYSPTDAQYDWDQSKLEDEDAVRKLK